MLTPEDALTIVTEMGVLIEGHFVTTHGKHVSKYIAKHILYQDEWQTKRICRAFADLFLNDDILAVIGPESGGAIIAHMVATRLAAQTGKYIVSVPAKKDSSGNFFLTAYDAELVAHKRTLVVDDVATTGGSLRAAITAGLEAKAIVVAAGALFNRGGVTKEELGLVDKFSSFIYVPLDSWDPPCPLCRKNIPIDPTPGK